MARDIDVFGHKISPWAAGAIGVGSLLVIYYAYKQHKNSQANSASNPSAIDPVTGLPYSEDNTVDPLTGQTYLAEAQAYGSVAAAEQAVSAESASAYSSQYGSGYYGSSGNSGYYTGTSTGTVTDVPSSGYTTNAQWVAAATAGLEAIGYSASDVNAALGAYLANLPETASQAAITNTALSEYGPPPVGSYMVVLASSTTTASAGGTGSTSHKPITVTPVDLHTTQVSNTSVGVAWAAPTIPSGQGPLTGYTAQVFNSNGSAEGTPWTVPPTQLYANAGGLKSKTTYHINVWCDPAQTGGPHASVTFTTK